MVDWKGVSSSSVRYFKGVERQGSQAHSTRCSSATPPFKVHLETGEEVFELFLVGKCYLKQKLI